jgi:hypothetical protein
MLVLSRKKNERIVIAGEIVITLVGIEGNRVRIGISAPPTCPSCGKSWSASRVRTTTPQRSNRTQSKF